MKRVVFLLGCLFLVSGILFAQDEKVVFNETVHDFGEIQESGGSVTCDFVLTNNSDAPVVINKVTTSCGCTSPSWTREPIEPGKTGVIKATYNPRGRPGAFSKTITVYTSHNTNPFRLRIKGSVQREATEPKDPRAGYPKKMGSLLMKDTTLDFGALVPRSKAGIKLEVYNDSETQLILRTKDLPVYIKLQQAPDPIRAKSAGTINVEFDASAAGYGNHNGTFFINLDNTPYSFTYSASVADDFSKLSDEDKAKAGRINLGQKTLDFGDMKSKDRVLKLSNSGKTDLHINLIQAGDPLLKVSEKALTIKPNEIKEVKVTLDTKKAKRGFSSSITVISDDPTASVKTIPVKTTP